MNRSESVLSGRQVTGSRGRRSRTRGRRRRTRGCRRRIGLPRIPPRMLIAIVVVLVVLAGAWLWLRDSSLVGVRKVTITGVSGPDAAQIRSALSASARSMTTLDVNMGHLRTAVAPYPVVKALHVSTDFPHAIKIAVIEQVPVAVVVAPGRRITVSADGTLLHDAGTTSSLPSIEVGVAPGGTHVTGGARQLVRLLAAAPYPLLAKVGSASTDPVHGLVVHLRNGPAIYFGGANRLGSKWDAAAQVLADSGSAGAAYIDVSVPARAVAGTGSDTDANGSGTSSQSSGSTGGTGE